MRSRRIDDQAPTYQVGRKKTLVEMDGTFSNDAVLTYAMRGSGRKVIHYRLHFALWQIMNGKRVGVCQSVFWFNRCRIQTSDDFIKENTIDKFGPVRGVT
jgi:hypothetical protein